MIVLAPCDGTDAIEYLACSLVLATFCMQAMEPLRMVAVCSNGAFRTYGWLMLLWPILILHCILTIVNLISLCRQCARAIGKPPNLMSSTSARRHTIAMRRNT